MSGVTAIEPHACHRDDLATTIPAISGVGFTGATGVRFQGVQYPLQSFDALSPLVESDGRMTCRLPTGRALQQYDVIVRHPSGDMTLAQGFVIGGTPTVSYINREGGSGPSAGAKGSTAGGQLITFGGTWLDETTEVRFGGVAATSLAAQPFENPAYGSRRLTCTLPAHSVGVVDVEVVSRYRSVTKVGAFTYGEPPRIDLVVRGDDFERIDEFLSGGTTPALSGPRVGGYGLVMRGAHFATCFGYLQAGRDHVTGQAAYDGGPSDDTFIARIPPATRGGCFAALAVENAFGVTIATQRLWVYDTDDHLPWFPHAFYPSDSRLSVPGPKGRRTMAQTVGNVSVPLKTSGDSEPAWTTSYLSGGGWVTTYPDPVLEPSLRWSTWAFPGEAVDLGIPRPTAITPAWDWVEGGVACRIDGEQFIGGGAFGVYFGETLATDFVLVDDHTITCTAPPHAAGVVDVIVVGLNGDGVLSNGFTYRARPRRKPVLYVHT